MKLKKIAYLHEKITEVTVTVPSPPDQPVDDFIMILEKLADELYKRGYERIQRSFSNEEGIIVSGRRSFTEEEIIQIEIKLKDFKYPEEVCELVLSNSG